MSQTMWAFDYDITSNVPKEERATPTASLMEALASGKGPCMTLLNYDGKGALQPPAVIHRDPFRTPTLSDQDTHRLFAGDILDSFAFECAEELLKGEYGAHQALTRDDLDLLPTLRRTYCRGDQSDRERVRLLVLEQLVEAYQQERLWSTVPQAENARNRVLILTVFLAATGFHSGTGSADSGEHLITRKVAETIQKAAYVVFTITHGAVVHSSFSELLIQRLAARLSGEGNRDGHTSPISIQQALSQLPQNPSR